MKRIRTLQHAEITYILQRLGLLKSPLRLEQVPVSLLRRRHVGFWIHAHGDGSLKTHDHQHDGSLKTHDHQHDGSLKTHDHQLGGAHSIIQNLTTHQGRMPSSDWICKKNNSFKIKTIKTQTDLQDNKYSPGDIPWGYIDLNQIKKNRRNKRRKQSKHEKFILYINNTKLEMARGEEDRSIYFQIIDIPLKMGSDIHLYVPVACNFDYVPYFPDFPKRHRMVRRNRKALTWETY